MLEKFEMSNWTYSIVQEHLLGYLCFVAAEIITCVASKNSKILHFSKDFRVGVMMSFIVPFTVTGILTLVSNFITGIVYTFFGIESIVLAIWALFYLIHDNLDAVGKFGWNTNHLKTREINKSVSDPNLAYRQQGKPKNNSTYLLEDGTYRQFDMDKISRTKDSKLDFYEILLNLLISAFLAIMVKTDIGSVISMLILTLILAGLFFMTYRNR